MEINTILLKCPKCGTVSEYDPDPGTSNQRKLCKGMMPDGSPCKHKFAVHVKAGWRTRDGKPAKPNVGITVRHDPHALKNIEIASTARNNEETTGKTASTARPCASTEFPEQDPSALPCAPSEEQEVSLDDGNLPQRVSGNTDINDKTASMKTEIASMDVHENPSPSPKTETKSIVNTQETSGNLDGNSRIGVPARKKMAPLTPLLVAIATALCKDHERQCDITTCKRIKPPKISKLVKILVDNGYIFKCYREGWNSKTGAYVKREMRGIYEANPLYFEFARPMNPATPIPDIVTLHNHYRQLVPTAATKHDYDVMMKTLPYQVRGNGFKAFYITDAMLGKWVWRNYRIPDFKVWIYPNGPIFYPWGKGQTSEEIEKDYDNFVRSIWGLIEQYSGNRVKFLGVDTSAQRRPWKAAVEPDNQIFGVKAIIDNESPNDVQRGTLNFVGDDKKIVMDAATRFEGKSNKVEEHEQAISDLKAMVKNEVNDLYGVVSKSVEAATMQARLDGDTRQQLAELRNDMTQVMGDLHSLVEAMRQISASY